MTNTYIDCLTYLRQPIGQELKAIVSSGYTGNMGRLGAVSQGATSLSLLTAATAQQSQYDNLYIFDGPSSEMVQIGASVSTGATTISLQSPTIYAHAAGIAYCTDGSLGSLGDQIFTASKWIEDDICHQSLWQTTYSNEILTMPTMRAAVDNQNNLHFRPRHFPVTAIASISVQTSQQVVCAYDPSAAIIDSDQQTVDVPNLYLLSTSVGGTQSSPWFSGSMNRRANAWITLGYSAGFAQGQLPYAIQRACALLTSECFAQLRNPLGADQTTLGKQNIVYTMRGDTSGESLLVKQAARLLSAYIAESF